MNDIAQEQATSTWQLDPLRAPALKPYDELMYCEHGRIVYRTAERNPGDGVDHRSHWYRVVKNRGTWYLLVQHGGGEERIDLGYSYMGFPSMFDPLTSDGRFRLMWQLMAMHREAARRAAMDMSDKWRMAFVEGRLKKRKVKLGVRVWIEDPKQ